ncbi:DUF839 domain-containing protein [bacterium]|nr:DUF839 domain-containing protein [bacterium]MBU1958888.1 DUF839 domain-containing protein [bacterium]
MFNNSVLSLMLVLAGSFMAYGDSDIKSMRFAEISMPKSESQKVTLQTTKKVILNGQEQQIDFTPLMVTGHKDNNETFGLLKDSKDKPILFEDGSDYICNGTNSGEGAGLDFSSILQKNGKLYMVSQFECAIGAMYMFELNQDTTTGQLTPKKDTLQYVSQKSEFGGFTHCAGVVTPWNSHLGSEEYEADARDVEVNRDIKGWSKNSYYNETAKFFGGDMNQSNPYYYGWVPEVKISADGTPNYSKHYAMGRFSHEVSYVMPDKKTVYMSDDGTNVGLFRFVADRAEDLSSGRLYVAKVKQISAKDGGAFTLSWMDLGHATDAEIRTQVAKKPKFSDFFETANIKDNTCPLGFSSINTLSGHECLKLKKGVDEKVVSRVESRRYAALKGGSTEFRKEEGVSYNPLTNRLYVSMSTIEKGMEDFKKANTPNSFYDRGGNNDIKLPYNRCGAIYELELDNDYKAVKMKAVLTGRMIEKDVHGNSCAVNSIANPDNISILKGSNILSIAEDTTSHENNMIWAYDLESKHLTRVITVPLKAESTSLFWYENINGWAYMTAVTQHPSKDLADKGQSSIGVLGPVKLK